MRYLFILSLLFITPAWAEEPAGTRVLLSAQTEALAANDEVVVTFRIIAEGALPKSLQREVNRISQTVDQRLSAEQLELKTTDRRMAPQWDRQHNRRIGWRLEQTAEATSQDLDAVPEWVQAIEKLGVKLQSVRYRVSSKASRAMQDELRMQAVASFRAKAAAMAKALSARSYRIVSVQTTHSQPVYPARKNMVMGLAMEADGPPGMQAGESRISASVSGEIELPSRDFPAK
ncbi:MAG: SIMPL domain-containing protein [Mariprofundaceae bacterium]